MIDFEKLTDLTIEEGVVSKIEVDGVTKWERFKYRYVSLGDSISAGHTINADWEKDYGTGSQYGENGNESTKIVEKSYTDLLHKDLSAEYGKVAVTSFGHSGDTVADLMEKLTHDTVRQAISKADLVTICIGANDILGSVSGDRVRDYIMSGSLAGIEADVDANLAILDSDDPNATSYRSLFTQLMLINPDAKYVFTTVYNPYKYLYIEEGANGFFEPLLDGIPNMDTNVMGVNFDVDGAIKDALFDIGIVQQLFDRVNRLGEWVEKYVTQLNKILREKIESYPFNNVILADTKAVFDPVPDRPISAPKHYNDLVNVEYTRGYAVKDMDWGELYDNNVIKDEKGNPISDTVCNSASTFWRTLANSYRDGMDIDWNGLGTTLVAEIVNHVLMPDLDPHPEEYGQYALKCSFADAIGLSTLPRRTITYNANGGTGSMASQTVVALDGNTAYIHAPANGFGITSKMASEGYRFVGWQDENDNAYKVGDLIGLTGNITLYAQWSDIYTLTLICEAGEGTLTGSSSDTGVTASRMCYVNGNVLTNRNFGEFKNSPDKISVKYGTDVGTIIGMVSNASGGVDPRISLNGNTVAKFEVHESIMPNGYGYTFTLTKDTTIRFIWYDWRPGGINLLGDAYWDCHITTQ